MSEPAEVRFPGKASGLVKVSPNRYRAVVVKFFVNEWGEITTSTIEQEEIATRAVAGAQAQLNFVRELVQKQF